ncbi:MAG TPA: hypothetical protein VGL19_06755, partial [Polyangiaceae bacterium]
PRPLPGATLGSRRIPALSKRRAAPNPRIRQSVVPTPLGAALRPYHRPAPPKALPFSSALVTINTKPVNI